jgi:hypothetical protein
MMKWQLRAGDDTRLLWLLAFSVLCTGAFQVETRYPPAIAASHDRTEILYRQSVANARLVQEATALRGLQQRAQNDLLRVSHDTSPSQNVANLLLALQSAAVLYGTSVLAIETQGASAGLQDSHERDPALQASDLKIRLRGQFANILRFVANISHRSTLVSVSHTEMSVSPDNRKTSEPLLDATIHATLYRLQLADKEEGHIASAR